MRKSEGFHLLPRSLSGSPRQFGFASALARGQNGMTTGNSLS